ncbi:MAG: hypothetical protein ACOYXM_12575 [Actinomycetota bacterium]
MILMVVMGLLMMCGLALTARWITTGYKAWDPQPAEAAEEAESPSPRSVALRYLRGVAVALVGGFWAGALLTGPAIRLIMRLLAVTAGDDVQGRLTEAEEVVGEISLGGTIGLFLFGGVFVGMLSAAIYVVIRRWLPSGPLGGVTFGLLHLVVAATRIDPLRPDNPDFDIVGPTWLALVTFGATAILHGMAVTAICNRYSGAFPRAAGASRSERNRVIAPLVLPALLLIPGVLLLLPLTVGLGLTVASSQVPILVRGVRSRGALVAGRVAVGLIALAYLPGAVDDLIDVVDREEAGALGADMQVGLP